MRQWRPAAIVNPLAGNGRGRRVWARERARLEAAYGPIEACETERPGHASELARRLRSAGHDLLFVVGGDGSLSEAAGGLLDGDVSGTEVTLAPVPAGRCCDFSRVLTPGKPRLVDAVRVGFTGRRRRWLLNMASLGLGAEVVRRRRGSGPGGYLWGAAAALARSRAFPVRLTLDGTRLECRAVHVALGNGSCQGGGMRLCPLARLDDGLLEVTVVGDVGLAGLLANLHLLYSGRIYDHPEVRHFRAARLFAEAETGVEIDGDPEAGLPAEFLVVPKALQVVLV